MCVRYVQELVHQIKVGKDTLRKFADKKDKLVDACAAVVGL